MTLRLTIDGEARLQVRTAHRWWKQNRERAPLLFAQEFAGMVSIIRQSPDVGVTLLRRGIPGLRRALMRKTSYHIYYVHTETYLRIIAVWSAVRGRRPKLQPPARRQAALSPREQEIVRLAAMGHPNKIIAYKLNISIWTVNTHLRHIFAKLNVSSRAAMVAKVLGSERMDLEYQQLCSA